MKVLLTFLALVLFMSGFANGQPFQSFRRYVTQTGAGLKNGTTWADAYDGTQLQTAINEPGEVWVARGTYYPTTGTDRTISFNMKEGVAIYGGFVGTETDVNQRQMPYGWIPEVLPPLPPWHPAAFGSILSGNIGDPYSETDNSKYVVLNSNIAFSPIPFQTKLDGFTIEGSYQGAGIANYNASPTISNCRISYNRGFIGNGGGIYNEASSPIIENCLIVWNESNNGGGIYNCSNSQPQLTNCTISKNSAYNGGGIYSTEYSSPTINNSIIWGNKSNNIGNQIYCEDDYYYNFSITNSCYANGLGDIYFTGTFDPQNCITSAPKFINRYTDFRIAGNSPCVDAGGDWLPPNVGYNSPNYDIRWASRKSSKTDASAYGRIDMGAYEFQKGVDPDVLHNERIYVNINATGANNGTSWADAYTSLSSAIWSISNYDQVYEVWVAAGTYKPTTGTDRSVSFNMKNDVAIYGGFAGSETLLSQRNWTTNVTVLSGDIGIFGDTKDNSYHVIYNYGLNNSAILDGFTIQEGNAWENQIGGGGVQNIFSSPSLTNCIIRKNTAFYNGGGMSNKNSSPTLTNCLIAENTASRDDGGGIYNFSSSLPTLTNCTITANTAGSWGGGICSEETPYGLVVIRDLSGAADGGGKANVSSSLYSASVINNSIIWGNTIAGPVGLNYSCYEDIGGSVTANNCITSDPFFVNAKGSDYRIAGNSPCADTGSDALNSETTDIRGPGFGRKLLKTDAAVTGTIDMGAYEFNNETDSGVCLPSVPGTITGSTIVCLEQSSVVYTVPTIANATSYLWTLPTGVTGTSTTNSITVSYGATAVSGNITVKGHNDCGDGATSTLAITVNIVPFANAGIDQSVNEGVTVTLDGSVSSDADGNALTYKWTEPQGITLSSDTASKPTFTAPEVKKDTVYTFSLMVNDGLSDSPSDTVVVTVKNASALQEISLIAGWNIISANVVPANLNLKDIFQSYINSGNLKKVMDEAGKTVENFGIFGGWKNNIGNLTATEGYKVNMKKDTTLSLEGAPVPLPLKIPLTAGWNIISYPSTTLQDGKALVQSLIDAGKITKVMDESGKTIENFGIFGGWKNNIGNFVPGKGYKVKVASDTTLTIPAIATKAAAFVPEVLASTHFIKVFAGNGTDHMNVSLVDLQTSGLQVGDEIGIFDGSYCVGSATIGLEQINSGSISIPASANEGNSTSVNGFTIGNAIGLQLYRGNQSYKLETESLVGSLSFEKNGSVFIKVSANGLPVVQTDSGPDQFRCYPNPFKDELTIEIWNSEETVMDVAIYNLLGQKIKNLYKGSNKGELTLKWNGTNDSGHKVAQGVYLCKMNGQAIKVVYKH